MSELFYRLRSQTNVTYFVLARDERKNKVVTFIKHRSSKIAEFANEKTSKIDPENLKSELSILHKANAVVVEFDQIDFSLTNLSIDFRLKLAEECMSLQNEIFTQIHKEIKGMDYATMSNEKFEKVLRQESTNYLFIALYLNECWAKLLEYRLGRI